MPGEAVAQASVSLSSLSDPPLHSSRPRSYSRPLPIVVHSCLSPPNVKSHAVCAAPLSSQIKNVSLHSQTPVEPITSPAFLKGDLNFATFRERAARAIAEWGPSPTVSHFSASNVHVLTPRPNQSIVGTCSAPLATHGLKVPSTTQSPFSSPPVTPLTPAPHSQPQHREQNSAVRRSSLKLSKRPRPSPLQLKGFLLNDPPENDHQCELEFIRNVRFADGSPLRGSTWHITQYPARLASPPISAANLSLADLIELQAIKQSLGTWCGEMMGSPMRGSFSQSPSSTYSISDSGTQKSGSHTSKSFLSLQSYVNSPISCSLEDEENPWGEAKWPDYLSYDSDCDSEIFEGMH